MSKTQKFAVIGATGYVGSAVVKELANRGHQVTAFARNINKVEKLPNVTAVSANISDSDFAQKLAGFDAIVSAFSANSSAGMNFIDGSNAILASAKTANVPYILIVGGAGSLYVADNVQLVDTPDFPDAIRDEAKVARDLLTQIKQRDDVNWAFISPPALLGKTAGFSEERTGSYQLGDNRLIMNGEIPAGISVADLAIAIADDLEQKAHLHQHFTAAMK